MNDIKRSKKILAYFDFEFIRHVRGFHQNFRFNIPFAKFGIRNEKTTPKQHAILEIDGKWRDDKAMKDVENRENLVKKMYGGGRRR